MGMKPRTLPGHLLTTTLALSTVLFASSSAMAFSEDLCLQPNGAGGNDIVNCMDAAHCGPNAEEHTHCRVNSVMDAAQAMGNGRSIVHTDLTHFMAQAIGLRGDVAYWLAAYNEIVDANTYIPFDMYGDPADETGMYTTATLNGWSRQNPNAGGFTYHFPAVFKYTASASSRFPGAANPSYAVDGTHPHLDDAVSEGMLYHLRSWALTSQRQGSCVNGFTVYDSALKSFFSASQCWRPNDLALKTVPGAVPKWIQGMMPTFTVVGGAQLPFASYSGTDIVQYTPPANMGGQITDVRFDNELGSILSGSSGVLFEDSDPDAPVPASIVRMGMYLHVLQDRISHATCGDASTVNEPDTTGYFHFNYSPAECTQDQHAVRHYEEIGFPPAQTPERVYSSLSYAWDEMVQFAKLHPEWLVHSYTPAQLAARKRQIIGTRGALTAGQAISQVVSVTDGCERLRGMIQLTSAWGFEQMPGNEGDPATMCP